MTEEAVETRFRGKGGDVPFAPLPLRFWVQTGSVVHTAAGAAQNKHTEPVCKVQQNQEAPPSKRRWFQSVIQALNCALHSV